MGLTIHYQGQVLSEAALETVVSVAQDFAVAHGWQWRMLAEAKRQMIRKLQPEDPEAAEVEEMYTGPTQGIYLLPHAACEPLVLEFDRDLFMQDECKTQFAGPETHAAIVRFFGVIEPLFEMLDVHDEADFWEGGQTEADLARTFASTRAAIDAAAEEMPGSAVGVLTPSGRILDVLAA